jgi:uncharacterized lipoprotein YajG
MFIKVFKVFIAVVLLGLVTSCGYIPHDVTIDPDLPVKERNIGNDKTLQVSVQDARPKTGIGYRTYMKTGNISVDKNQDLVETIKLSIEDGFSTIGFKIIQEGSPDRDVEVDISLIEYEV